MTHQPTLTPCSRGLLRLACSCGVRFTGRFRTTEDALRFHLAHIEKGLR